MMDPAQLRRLVEAQFRVYEAREEKVRGKVAAHLFYVMFPAAEFDARYAAVREAIMQADKEAVVFMRRDRGEDILLVADRPPAVPGRPGLHVGLFLATLLTTAVSGAAAWHGYRHGAAGWQWSVLWDPVNLLWGTVTFALPLLAILGIHEGAHYLAARRHRLRATLPYFIPAPPLLMPIGTFGAYIRMKDPLPDRKTMFDVGAAGPIAGFLVALPVILLGALLTAQNAVAVPDIGRPLVVPDQPGILDTNRTGTTLLTLLAPQPGILTFQVANGSPGPWSYHLAAEVTTSNGTRHDELDGSLEAGGTERRTLTLPTGTTQARLTFTWDDGLTQFGDSLLTLALEKAIPTSQYMTHPTFFAGWVGLLVTGINLLPVGQLDGGHVSRAVFGERNRYVANVGAFALVALAALFSSWLIMAIFVFMMGVQHPPPLNDRTRLGPRRIALAIAVLVIFALCFVPIPLSA